jgi:sugar/nucleoside kinase (ribokinase family)
MTKDEHTAISNIRYFENGERVETPEYGWSTICAWRRRRTRSPAMPPGASVFICLRILSEAFWDRLLEYRQRMDSVCLGINADAAKPERSAEVMRRAEECDIFSINRTEAMALFDTTSEQRAIGALVRWGCLWFTFGAERRVLWSSHRAA